MKQAVRYILMAGLIGLLAACGSSEPPIKGQKVGKPYMIGTSLYFPRVDNAYDETGMASWYGPGFHGKYTANGEVFNQNALTAAHPTLPMPSMVRVTNLDNGRSAVIRINDRGPFKGGRIIDLSKESAHVLDIHGKGLARVRVQYLPEETQAYLNSKGIKAAPGAAEKAYAKAKPQPAEPQEEMEMAALDEEETQQAVAVSSVQVSDLGESKPQKPRFRFIREAEAADVPFKPAEPEEPVNVRYGEPKQESVQPKVIRLGQTEEELPKVDTSAEARSQAEAASVPRLDPAAGGHVVQAGSFASESNAKALGTKLEKLGQVEVLPVDVAGRTLYRVRVGGVSGSAEEALEMVRAEGASGARIVTH